MDEERSHAEFYKDAKHLYDVPYISRYGSHEEELEMERFIRAAAAEGLQGYLVGLFYDSKACFCDIETDASLSASDPAGERLIQAATAHISQFHLLGAIGHRR